MSNAAKLKKKAIELEQKKQFDKALALYVQFLQESDGSLDDADISLYNRVGDLMLRTGNSSDALAYFEKAVDLYAERGFHNNAIALYDQGSGRIYGLVQRNDRNTLVGAPPQALAPQLGRLWREQWRQKN